MAAVLKINGCNDIERLLEVCGISNQKIQIDDNVNHSSSKIPSLTFNSGVTVEGLQTIATYIASIACESLLGETRLEKAGVHQWLEYRQTDVEHGLLSDRSTSKPVLQDFNCHLTDKVYLTGNKLSLADIMLYYALHGILSEMMPQEKESYINISRWFKQVQSILSSRQGLSLLAFQRNQLYT